MKKGTSPVPGKQERESYCQTGASGMIFSGSMTWMRCWRLAGQRPKGKTREWRGSRDGQVQSTFLDSLGTHATRDSRGQQRPDPRSCTQKDMWGCPENRDLGDPKGWARGGDRGLEERWIQGEDLRMKGVRRGEKSMRKGSPKIKETQKKFVYQINKY